MATITNSLGSFNTDHITLNNALMTLKIPFMVESEQVKEIIKESYNTFKKTHPEAANPYHETYIFFNLGRQMQVSYDFVVSIYDNKQGITKKFNLWQMNYRLNNEAKEEIKRIAWKQLSELMFGK